MFKKILIANRGEIACRVMQTAQKLGVQTVAVYSEADAHALHVEMADQAIPIGPAASRESYLCIDKIIAAAKQTGAEAIHPGYGFLSENAEFAQACADNGLIFIGPSAAAITAMGSKSGAKALMEKAGVPLVPGYHGDNQETAYLLDQAKKMGFPVLLKASAGGGGKGMRAVHHESEFADALQAAQREALNAFGDQRMLVEKLLLAPRHVEVQILADGQGACVYIFDRDCSIQRRHQKVVEEAPAPGLSATLRRAMGEAAVRAALAINYQGAGTLEFLVDSRGDFYFMEMNTRLQVEHPVSELIAGLDLVEMQLRVASGEALPFTQEALSPCGHAIEVRLYAEDPEREFLPSTGKLRNFNFPTGDGIRVDTGYRAGDTISVHYDPMMAKLIAWGQTREQAAARLHHALRHTDIAGVRHNAGFLARLMTQADFLQGKLHTGFIEEHSAALLPQSCNYTPFYLMAALLQQHRSTSSHEKYSPWQNLPDFRLSTPDSRITLVELEGEKKTVSLTRTATGFQWEVDEQQGQVSFSKSANSASITINGMREKFRFCELADGYDIFQHGQHFFLKTLHSHAAGQAEAKGAYNAPMNGRIVSVLVKAGDMVKAGDTLLVMEAMKMEHRIRAHQDGTVTAVNTADAALISEGQVLVALEDSAP